MEGFVTLLFIRVEGQNLADWGILMCIFPKKLSIFKIQGIYKCIISHNKSILERPCNFAIFEGRNPKFCKLYNFDVFS